jgi:hypothetical protein
MVHCECYCWIQPREICSIEHAQDSLVCAYTVVSIGMSDIGVVTMSNQKALFVTLVDHVPQFEAVFRQAPLIRCAYESLRCLNLEIWRFWGPQMMCVHVCALILIIL